MTLNETVVKPTLVVLAAGMGSRYGGLKQIDPVGPSGETVLDYSVYDALRAGFGKVVFVIRRDFEDRFRDKVVRPWEAAVELRCAYQDLDDLPGGRRAPAGREKPWGTGHAIWCARPAVAEPFAVINADDFYGAEAFQALAEHFRNAPSDARPLSCALVGYRLDRTLSRHGPVARGVVQRDAAGFLEDITEVTGIEAGTEGVVARRGTEMRQVDPDTLVSLNCWGFQPGLFSHFEERLARFLAAHGDDPKREFYVADPVESAVRDGVAVFRVIPDRGCWFGVTYREEKEEVVRAIASRVESGEYPSNLWSESAR